MDKQSNPCSLYLSLLPENEIKNVYISDSDEEGFRQYLTEQVQMLNDKSCEIPNTWLVQINFENRRNLEVGISKIESAIRSELEQQKGKIMHTICLMDAYYCHLKHIDPLLEENKFASIAKTPDYFMLTISTKSEYTFEHSLMGIRTDRGVHVFSADWKGMEAMNACLQYYEKHFFCREHATNRLEVIYIKAIGEMPAPCGNLFFENKNLKTTPLHLPQDYFCPDKSLLEITCSKFDMRPTIENYSTFCTKNGKDPMKSSTSNFEFLCLAQIRDAFSHHLARIFPEWPDNTAFGNDFLDLFLKYGKCKDIGQLRKVQKEIKDFAARLIGEKYPDKICFRDPDQIKDRISKDEVSLQINKIHRLKF